MFSPRSDLPPEETHLVDSTLVVNPPALNIVPPSDVTTVDFSATLVTSLGDTVVSTQSAFPIVASSATVTASGGPDRLRPVGPQARRLICCVSRVGGWLSCFHSVGRQDPATY